MISELYCYAENKITIRLGNGLAFAMCLPPNVNLLVKVDQL